MHGSSVVGFRVEGNCPGLIGQGHGGLGCGSQSQQHFADLVGLWAKKWKKNQNE